MTEAKIPQSGEPPFKGAAPCRHHYGRQWPLGRHARGLPRAEGHRRGVEALRRTIRAAGEIGISFVTIFSFSAEKWSRPGDGGRRTDGTAAPIYP